MGKPQNLNLGNPGRAVTSTPRMARDYRTRVVRVPSGWLRSSPEFLEPQLKTDTKKPRAAIGSRL